MSAGMKGLSLMEVLRADRLPECSFDDGRTWETDDVGVAETFASAADRIATLDQEVERWISAYNIAHDQASANGSRIATLEDEVVRLQKEIDRWHTGKMTLITMTNGQPCIMHWPDDPNAEVRDPDTGEVIFPAVKTPLRLVPALDAGEGD